LVQVNPRASVRLLETVAELGEVNGLFRGIWGGTGSQVAMPVNLLRALVHSGGYVSGAYADDRLAGAAVGWLGERGGVRELHSHVVGVAQPAQGRGIGLALKLHQRDWARARGLAHVTWTFDPLTRRNGWFNLAKLGARAVEYHLDFYGVLLDDLNGSDETDRCLVVWDVAGSEPSEDRSDPGAARRLLSAGPETSPEPVVDEGWRPDGTPLSCQVPADIVALRRGDARLARRWRLALRATMGTAMARGYAATAMTRDGCYLLIQEGSRP
jgi:predicted GNAT superfamily acetyltransferase